LIRRSENMLLPMRRSGLLTLILPAVWLAACSAPAFKPSETGAAAPPQAKTSKAETPAAASGQDATTNAASGATVTSDATAAAPAADGTAGTAAPAVPSVSPQEQRRQEQLAALPADVKQAFDHGVTAMKAKNWETAEAVFKPLVDQHPDLPGAAVNLALIYERTDRASSAKALLEHTAQYFPHYAPGPNELGVLLAKDGEFDKADKAYEKAISADPGFAAAHYNRGVLNDLYLERPDVALAEYQAYLAIVGSDETVSRWVVSLQSRK